MKHTRILIWILPDGFAVVGYHKSEFKPLERFETIGEAAEFAVKVPVKNSDHPINIVRR